VMTGPAFLNDRTAAAMIGSMSHDKVRQLRLNGTLAFVKEGGLVQIPREAVEHYIAAQKQAAEDEQRRRMRISGVSDPSLEPYVNLIYAKTKKRSNRG
jgi:hypothetical protein